MKLASLALRFVQVRTAPHIRLSPELTSFIQFALTTTMLALSIHISILFHTNYYAKHGMPDTARYGAWAGGYGILIALIGTVLTIIGRAHAIIMICLDVLAAIFFLVCGFVRSDHSFVCDRQSNG